MLRDAVIVEGAKGEVVEAGTIVEIRITGDDETQSYLIGSIEERNDEYDVLSTSSPLGQALVGRRVGESATYETPRRRNSASRSSTSAPSEPSGPALRRIRVPRVRVGADLGYG